MVPLQDLLKSRFGDDFPVGEGSTKRDDPLVISDRRDYVSIEYGVAKFLLEQMGLEHEFEGQQTHHLNGRIIDELVYAAKEPGSLEWTQTRRFFFDISIGSLKRNEPSMPPEPIAPLATVRSLGGSSSSPKLSRSRSVLAGGSFGLALGIAWLLFIQVWGRWGVHLVEVLLWSPRDGGPSPLMLNLTPVVAGALIFAFGIEWLKRRTANNWATWASPRIVALAAASCCSAFAIFMAGVSTLGVLLQDGFLKIVFASLVLAYLVVPTWAAIWAARK